jgi:integrase
MLDQVNDRLKSANVGVRIYQRGNRLALRATLPPRPESLKCKSHQQFIPLDIYANPAGFKRAEMEAHRIGTLLALGKFDWAEFLAPEIPDLVPVSSWLKTLEERYFEQRQRTTKSQGTWDKEYFAVLRQLPQGGALTVELLEELVRKTKPDSRTRRRVCYAASALAGVAGLQLDVSRLIGNYSPRRASPRDIPGDTLISEWRDRIPNQSWQWAYGVMAVYGLRNHEIGYIDLESLQKAPGIISILEGGKTGARRVWPCYPEWWEAWRLWDAYPPNVQGKNNSDLGHRMYVQFERYGLPFNPYDLRHAWAVRTIYFGWDVSLSAAQMGHSVQVHCDIYHHWLTDQHHQRAFEVLMNRSDRPLPPNAQGQSI